MLRTNLQADSAEELWSRYMQLTEAQASFCALKSERRAAIVHNRRQVASTMHNRYPQ
jgi:hypothetical protein